MQTSENFVKCAH